MLIFWTGHGILCLFENLQYTRHYGSNEKTRQNVAGVWDAAMIVQGGFHLKQTRVIYIYSHHLAPLLSICSLDLNHFEA